MTFPFDCRLDYPGIGPEHSYLNDIGRAEYYAVTDDEALEAFQQVSRLEGIIPALETSHAFAYLKVQGAPVLSALFPFGSCWLLLLWIWKQSRLFHRRFIVFASLDDCPACGPQFCVDLPSSSFPQSPDHTSVLHIFIDRMGVAVSQLSFIRACMVWYDFLMLWGCHAWP